MPNLRLATIGAWGHFPHVFEEINAAQGVEVVALARALPNDDLNLIRQFALCAKCAGLR